MPVHNADIAAIFEEIADLLEIRGENPFRVRAYRNAARSVGELGRDLATLLDEGKELPKIPGFGVKTEESILHALAERGTTPDRCKLAVAAQYAAALEACLAKVRGVRKVTVGGSFRRMRETVGDLDILVAADVGSPVMERFTRYDEVKNVLSHGETRSSVTLKSELQVDLRLVPPESYGAALHYFTGSKTHNIAIRKPGQARRGWLEASDVLNTRALAKLKPLLKRTMG